MASRHLHLVNLYSVCVSLLDRAELGLARAWA